ncbi:acetylglutamate kinase [Ligilactobacillus equi]|uniref:acetylglutamate kinase n=1 Tax=Ligilactobacillus equi DSM 15833 = JCM 10991 TaxID=1423740 RepID=A0A0R1TW31_9LACO|nr:acetylglutamate kinase [Ligilactobacillus equi]KRL83242.1 Acetylglutamate kinase [Ligilactobacillus equi DSM 15833 = JCM 10991]
MHQDLVIIKLGGNALLDLSATFFQQLHALKAAGHKIILLHGGGAMISDLSTQLNLPVKKVAGIRVTDEATLKVTKMVLLGHMQPLLAQKLSQAGFSVTCQNAAMNHLLTGEFLDFETYGYVGTITQANHEALLNFDSDILILAPLALTPDGHWLNVNADQAACNLAAMLQVKQLYLLTDVAGVLNQGQVLPSLNQKEALALCQKEVITAGMQPKIKAAFQAKHAGVQHVFITNTLQASGTSIQ